jgi:multimeric flavodoxin WrbA
MSGKKLLVVLGSPRRNGNSATLAGEAMRGARENDATVQCHHLNEMDIRPCQACEYCRSECAETCCQNDDMQILYPEVRAADAILIAGPVYWFSICAQTKLFMDRLYAFGNEEGYGLRGKRIAIILTYGDADAFKSGAVNALRSFQDSFGYIGAEIVGMVYGSASQPGEIRENVELMSKAVEMGRRLTCA